MAQLEELRPRLRSPLPGAECGCGGSAGELGADADCVLLAELEVPIVLDAPTGTWEVADATAVTVDDTLRPTLLHLRFLQEWLLGGGGELAVSGRVNADGTVAAGTGGLTATALEPTVFLLDFPGFDPGMEHVVLGQPIAAFADTAPNTFEVIPSDDADLATALGAAPGEGVVVRVQDPVGNPVLGGFAVRIEQLGGGL